MGRTPGKPGTEPKRRAIDDYLPELVAKCDQMSGLATEALLVERIGESISDELMTAYLADGDILDIKAADVLSVAASAFLLYRSIRERELR